MVSATEEWDPKKGKEFTIDKQSDVLQLDDVADEVCLTASESTENCELFLQIKNNMEMEIDISLTLMSKHAIIELKEGIWETYALNSIASSSHFYFLPHHKDNDVSIIYKNSDT